MERDEDQKEVSGVGDSRCFACAKRVKKVLKSTRLFGDKSLSDHSRGNKNPSHPSLFPPSSILLYSAGSCSLTKA